jgi:hypothetical protein
MSNRIFLYSGQMGGKSTFTGGLFGHLQNREDTVVSHQIQYGRSEDFEKRILSQLLESHQYPHQNPELYIVDVTLGEGARDGRPDEITIVDFPGESIEVTRDDLPWNQQDTDSIERQYEELEIHDDDSSFLTPMEERKTMIQREYFQSDTVIFLLNFHKLLKTNRHTPVYDARDLRTVADEKDVALVAIGTDILDYKPDDVVVSSDGLLSVIWGSGSSVDSELLDTIDDTVTVPGIWDILYTAKSNENISFFGVAVPSRESGEDDRSVVSQNGAVETWGYENVLKWLS